MRPRSPFAHGFGMDGHFLGHLPDESLLIHQTPDDGRPDFQTMWRFLPPMQPANLAALLNETPRRTRRINRHG